MNNRKNRIAQAIVAAAVGTTSVQAAAIAVNFKGDAYSNPLGQDVSQTAYGIDAAGWTNLDGTDGGTNTAIVSGVNLSYTYANDWAQGNAYAGTTGEDEVAYGYLDDGGAGADITITGLSAYLAAEGVTSYSIQLLSSTGNGSVADFTDVALLDASGGTALGTFNFTQNTGGSGGWQGSSQMISGLSSDTLFIDGNPRNGNVRGSIAGFIITPVIPEPSTSLLTALAGLGLIARRKR